MKTLILKLVRNQGGNVQNLGFDIIWDNINFKFVQAESLGLFSIAVGQLAEGQANKAIIAASNITNPVTTDGDFLKIIFEYENNIEQSVNFHIENIVAKDEYNNDITLKNNIINISIETEWIIEWVWI